MKTTYNEKRFDNFREIVCNSAEQFGSKPAFLRKIGEKTEPVSYSELKERYYRLSTFLLDMGLGGKRIAVTGKNCFEWVLSYLCAATVGVAVPIDRELKPDDVKEFLLSADCKALLYDPASTLPETGGMITIPFPQADAISAGGKYCAAGLSGSGYPVDAARVNEIEFPHDETRVLIFTSGTTGNSKGVCLSQYNICSNIYSTVSIVKITESDTTLSILPLHHTYECTLNCLLLLSKGACITYVSSLRRIASEIKEYRPTLLVVVPAVLKLLDSRIKATIVKSCPKRYRAFFEGMTLSRALSETPLIVRRIIRSKVRSNLGGRLRLFIVGAAELDTELVHDFSALGIRTLQGYGLTECSPLVAGNSDFYFNAESTGIAIPGVEMKIESPNEEGVGEIIARGDNIMLGYFNDEAATERVMRGGWFHTGDLGYMDKDGALYIRGRIKNVIVTSNGKNIYPEELETRMSKYPEIKESLVLALKDGDVTKVKAKVFPDAGVIAEKLGHEPADEEIKAVVKGIIMEINEQVPNYKRIDVIEILVNGLEKTTTQKIRRYGANVE